MEHKNRVVNFSAGPSVLPLEVLKQAQEEFLNWKNKGASICELSHRNSDVFEMAQSCFSLIKDILNIPAGFTCLFVPDGARGQFAAVPLNILGTKKRALYIDSGFWSKAGAIEAQKYCQVDLISFADFNSAENFSFVDDTAYLYYCDNESIDGFEYHSTPKLEDLPCVTDMTSSLFTKALDFSKLDLVFASAQKNFGLSGLALVIVKDDLIGNEHKMTPSVLSYAIQKQCDSMFNTPAMFSWYMTYLYLIWIKKQGGLSAMQVQADKKSSLLYAEIDKDNFYLNQLDSNRSRINVCFSLADKTLEAKFLQEAEKAGLSNLKGHSQKGGCRASLYNAMDISGVQSLVDFMQSFRSKA